MVIKASAAREIDRLIAELGDANELRRESAIARLTVLGPRAVERLVAVVEAPASTPTRVSALRALEGIGDARTLELAIALMDDPDEMVAIAAIGLGRAHARSDNPRVSATALDRLTALVLDSSRPDALRLAAFEAFDDMPAPTGQPLRQRLRQDPSRAIRARVADPEAARPTPGVTDRLVEAAAGRLGDDPEALRGLVQSAGRTLPLPALHRILTGVKAREAAGPAASRGAWLAARTAIHEVLASRRSRLGLYDLRELFAAAREPLPPGLLGAIAALGDESCLEPLAAAYHHARAGRQAWWQTRLRETFQAILRRERITRRHPAVRRIVARQPADAAELLDRSSRSAGTGGRQ